MFFQDVWGEITGGINHQGNLLLRTNALILLSHVINFLLLDLSIFCQGVKEISGIIGMNMHFCTMLGSCDNNTIAQWFHGLTEFIAGYVFPYNDTLRAEGEGETISINLIQPKGSVRKTGINVW